MRTIIVFTSGRRWVYDIVKIGKRIAKAKYNGINEEIPLCSIERIIREKRNVAED